MYWSGVFNILSGCIIIMFRQGVFNMFSVRIGYCPEV